MTWTSLIVPLLFLAVFLYALFRRVRLYDAFTCGVKGAFPLVVRLFPYLAGILMLSALFEESGLSALLSGLLSPLFALLGIPPEIAPLVLIKPFSGSGSTALLSSVFSRYGADSYIARCAAVAYGSSETVFYVSAVYFTGSKKKKLLVPIVIALVSNLLGVVAGCFFCRFL